MSVVVVAYHRPDSLAHLLDSLDLESVEVVVVNVEDDRDITAVVEARRTDSRCLVLVCVEENRGYAAGVNAGVRASSSDFVVVCNDDVTVIGSAVDRLIEEVEERGGVAAPSLLDPSGRSQRSIAANPTLGRLALEWALLPDSAPAVFDRGLVHKWRRPAKVERVPGVAAAMLASRRELLLRNPMPEAYFMYWEEREWFLVLGRQQVPVWFVPDSHVIHAGGKGDVRSAKASQLAFNAVLCIRRTSGRAAASVAVPVVLVWQVRLLAQELVRFALRRSSLERLRARLAGIVGSVAASRLPVARSS